jgi:CheY-like chemotaxis protein
MAGLRAEPFDVLISDIAMPDRDGYEFIAEVRSSDEAFRSIPALALTALAREEDRRRAIAAGFDDVLTKPVQPARILKFLQTIAGEE